MSIQFRKTKLQPFSEVVWHQYFCFRSVVGFPRPISRRRTRRKARKTWTLELSPSTLKGNKSFFDAWQHLYQIFFTNLCNILVKLFAQHIFVKGFLLGEEDFSPHTCRGTSVLQHVHASAWLGEQHQGYHTSFETSSGETESPQRKLSSGHWYMMSTDVKKMYGNPGD